MKFFSNEAKENDPYDRSDVATSEPAAVPQQRAGSPWNETPGDPATDYRDPSDSSADAELAEQERRDGTDEPTSDRSDEPQVEQLSDPVTTTYGPDGTVTHSDEPVAEDDPVKDDTVADDTVKTEDEADEDSADEDSADEDSADEDSAVKDEGTFDTPEAVEPSTGEPIAEEEENRGKEPGDAAKPPADEPPADEPPADEPPADEPLTEEPVAEDEPKNEINGEPVAVEPAPVPVATTDEDTATDEDRDTDEDRVRDTDEDRDTVAVAAVPVETPAAGTPGNVPPAAVDRLFTDGDSFATRLREIQLRFVDSPKEATADAAALIGEAVDKITAALNSQKDSLSGDSDDTEQLRVQFRGYRDLLNRLTGL